MKCPETLKKRQEGKCLKKRLGRLKHLEKLLEEKRLNETPAND